MNRARAIFFSGVFVVFAAWPAAALACHPPAPWLEALHMRGRDSCCRGGARALRSAGAPAFVALPAVGPAPLTVTLGFLYESLESTSSIEFTVAYEGREMVHPASRPYAAEIQLSAEGRYEARGRVRAAGRPDFVATTSFEVVSRAAFEKGLREEWAAFIERVGRGDDRGAMQCLGIGSRPRKLDELRELVARVGTAPERLRFGAVDDHSVRFTVERQDAEGRVYEIVGGGFAVDVDGVWRLFFQ